MNTRKIKLGRRFLAAIILSSVAFHCHSSEENADDLFSLSLEDLLNIEISVASTTPETIFNSVSTVSIITAQQIKQYDFRTVADAVSSVAGFDVLRTYLKRSLPTARGILQDHYANKVLVMINGVPSWHAITGEGNLERINIHQIRRIEILKGPASVLYGTNAYSGAINLVLHRGQQSSLVVGAGTDNQLSLGASHTFLQENGSNFWTVSAYRENDNEHSFDFIDEQGIRLPLIEFIDSQNVTLHGQHGGHEILLNGYKNEESFLGVTPRVASGAGNPQKLEGYLLAYKLHHIFDNDADLQFNVKYDWNRRVFSRSEDNSIRADAWGQHVTTEVKYNRALTSRFDLELGLEHDYRIAKEYVNFNALSNTKLTHNNLKNRDVSSYSLFTQLGYHLENLKWLIGFRSVENELFGRNNSVRASLVYQPSLTSSIKFIAGQSYRSPSLFELYFRTDSHTVFGNPELQPEKSASYELSYLTAIDNFFIQANLYRASYADKIFRVKADVVLPDDTLISNTNQYANGDKLEATGLELELKYSNPKRFDAFVNFDFIAGNKGDRLPEKEHYNFKYVPDYNLSAGISKYYGYFQSSLIIKYRGDSQGPEAKIESSLLTHWSLSYIQPLSSVEITHTLRFENVFDERAYVGEYVRRRGLNQTPLEFGRAVTYQIALTF